MVPKNKMKHKNKSLVQMCNVGSYYIVPRGERFFEPYVPHNESYDDLLVSTPGRPSSISTGPF